MFALYSSAMKSGVVGSVSVGGEGVGKWGRGHRVSTQAQGGAWAEHATVLPLEMLCWFLFPCRDLVLYALTYCVTCDFMLLYLLFVRCFVTLDEKWAINSTNKYNKCASGVSTN